MHDDHPHPLLAQIPLTLSPFLSLPTAVPLPYSYVTLPSTLPPSILSAPQQSSPPDAARASPQHQQNQPQPAYVISSTGTTASHPDTILTSCIALQQHLQQMEGDARRVLSGWEEKRRTEDLAEKRRVAPGWLDSGVHILKPENVGGSSGRGEDGSSGERKNEEPQLMDLDPQAERKHQEGEELDRVFGGLKMN